jgi:hypothetical protein
MALRCKALEEGESINAETLKTLILDTLRSRNLLLDNFVAYVSDNCSYGKKAYKLLQGSMPNLKRVGCLSHIIHLLSKALFASEEQSPYFELVDNIVTQLNKLFSSRISVDDRARQYRFHHIFGRAARTLFWQVRGRWACKLATVLWLTQDDNRPRLLEFLATEIALDPDLAVLQTIQSLLTRPGARSQLIAVSFIAKPLHHLLLNSQTEDIAITAEIASQLDGFIAGLRQLQNRDYCATILSQCVSHEKHYITQYSPCTHKRIHLFYASYHLQI